MSKQIPQWKRLELLVEDIQRRLQPGADVRHDHRVKGRSGRQRKLDVTVTQTISGCPVFVVFDCKKHARPVGIKEVEAFVGQVKDVRANLGIMVSESGFDDGAVAVAAENNIALQLYTRASQVDWNALLKDDAWLSIDQVEMKNARATILLHGGTCQ